MTCFIARNLLTELVDDALPSSREPELREHLDGCPACSKELQELRRTRAMLRSLPVRRAPADFLSKVKAKAERKSALERVSIVLAPVLRLPRPAIGGLALAASLMVAVTVAIRHEQPDEGIFGYQGGPSAAKVVSGPAEPPKQEERETADVAGAGARLDEGKGAADPDRAVAQGEIADADGRQRDQSVFAADGKLLKDAPRPADATDEQRKKNDAALGRSATVPPPPSVPLGGVGSTAQEPMPKPAGTPAPVVKPGLYYSEKPATRSDSVANTTAPAAGAKAKSAPGAATGSTVTATATEEQDGFAASPDLEPAFDIESAPAPTRSAAGAGDKAGAKDVAISKKESKRRAEAERASAAPAAAQGAPGDDWGDGGSGMGSGGGSGSAASASGDASGWDSADSAPSDDRGALAETVVAAEKTPQKAPASTSSAAVATINARFTSAAPNGPAMVAEAARGAGAKLISGNPPSLGKSGASTNVVVEMAVSAVPAFEQALDAQGNFDLLGTPSGTKVRLRVEVVRE